MEDADCINMLRRLSNWEYSAATPYLKNCPNRCVCVACLSSKQASSNLGLDDTVELLTEVWDAS